MLFEGQQVATGTMCEIDSNRGFLYGDGVFESIRVMYGQALWPALHYQRLQNGLQQLGIKYPQSFPAFEKQLQELIALNKVHAGARLRVDVWRAAGKGFYTPDTSRGWQMMTIKGIDTNAFTLNTKGLLLGDSKVIKQNLFQPDIKTTSALQYVMAAQQAKAAGCDDALLFDASGGVLESSNSNIFLLKAGVLRTPPLSTGCLPGVMRRLLLEQLSKLGYQVQEQPLTTDDLAAAEEVYLTNAIGGLRWVAGWRTKRYFKKQAVKLVEELNQLALQSLTEL